MGLRLVHARGGCSLVAQVWATRDAQWVTKVMTPASMGAEVMTFVAHSKR